MRKFLVKTFALLLIICGALFWLRSDAFVLADTAALGLDDETGWLPSHSQDPALMDMVESSHAGFIRVHLPFNEVSPAPGIFIWEYRSEQGYKNFDQLFDKLDSHGIQPIVVLSGGPIFANHLYPQQPVFRDELLDAWSNYLSAAVQQFGQQVDYWQIGAAINDPRNWGAVIFPSAEKPLAVPDTRLYADMLRIAYSIIKSAQITDTVLLGSLALGSECAFHPISYLQELKDNDAWYAFDIISIELPILNDSPEAAKVDVCGYLPAQSSGEPLADSFRALADFVHEAGDKPIWAHGLSFSYDALHTKSIERGTLVEVVESDYLVRATAILMAEGGVDRVSWRYDPASAAPSLIALQSFSNLSQLLSGSVESSSLSLPDSYLQNMRFRGNGKLITIAWRTSGGDEFTAAVLPGFEGYSPYAWSADTSSLKNSAGFKLPLDNGGNVALMLSERPVIISGKPENLKGSITLFLKDSATLAKRSFKAKATGFFQAQKAKAAEQVSAWVEKNQKSLLDSLKGAFNQWLRETLGLAKF
ncbi:MAG: hypothetical protein KA449_01755 [Pelolinea sp.]|nr:hypothetical protein [Pelolinea sp.]